MGNANIKSADINGYYNENADVSAEYVYPTSHPNGYIYDILSAYFGNDGKLNVVLRYNGNEANPTGKLFVGTYDEADSEIMLDAKSYDIKGTTAEGLDYIKPGKGTVRLYIWDGVDSLNPLSGVLRAGGYSSADFCSDLDTGTDSKTYCCTDSNTNSRAYSNANHGSIR